MIFFVWTSPLPSKILVYTWDILHPDTINISNAQSPHTHSKTRQTFTSQIEIDGMFDLGWSPLLLATVEGNQRLRQLKIN